MRLGTAKFFAEIFGTDGPDTLIALNGDTIYALGGEDTIQANGGTVTVYAGADNDTFNISGVFTNSSFFGDDGNDIFHIITYDGSDTLFDGGSGDDSFQFVSFPVSLGSPNGGNALIGGDGFDSLDFDPFWLGFDMQANFTGQFGGTFDITNNITAGSYAFISVSGFEQLSMRGGGFTDTLRGGAGNDNLHDGGHHNFIMPPFSVFNLHEPDSLFGMGGDDVLVATGGTGDYLDGGDGNDTLTSGGNYFVSGNGVVTVRESSSTLLGGSGDDSIFSHGNDTIQGGSGDDYIVIYGTAFVDGGDGDDTIIGGSGDDRMIGGDGSDTLDGGGGFDIVDYSGSTSFIWYDMSGVVANIGDAALDTLSDIELIIGTAFNDRLYGDAANNSFRGRAGNDALFGRNGDDTLSGNAGNDILIGGNGSDVLSGGLDNDQLYGNSGDDYLNGNDGDDVLNGGDGIDRAVYALPSLFDYRIIAHPDGTITVLALSSNEGFDSLTSIEEISFDGAVYAVSDVAGIELTDGNDIYQGTADTDIIYALAGNDIVDGGAGDDILFGEDGADRFIGGLGADALNGGAGIDSADYTLASTGVTLSLITGGTAGDAAGDSYRSIEWVFGSDFEDDITGDDLANRLYGEDGNDTLNGAGGNDQIFGGTGHDTLEGGDGVDTLFGQAGDDTLLGGAGNDFFFGGEGSDSHNGGTGIDSVSYVASSAAVTVNMQIGGTGGDAAGDTYINVERVFGSDFDDSLTGSDGNDTLLGNDGDDFLAGRRGNDSLNGGAGNDSFAYNTARDGADVISGFTLDEVIEIVGGFSGLDAWADLLAMARDAGANTIFDFGSGNTLTIVGHNLSDLGANNFSFGVTTPAAQPLESPNDYSSEPLFTDESFTNFDIDMLI